MNCRGNFANRSTKGIFSLVSTKGTEALMATPFARRLVAPDWLLARTVYTFRLSCEILSGGMVKLVAVAVPIISYVPSPTSALRISYACAPSTAFHCIAQAPPHSIALAHTFWGTPMTLKGMLFFIVMPFVAVRRIRATAVAGALWGSSYSILSSAMSVAMVLYEAPLS